VRESYSRQENNKKEMMMKTQLELAENKKTPLLMLALLALLLTVLLSAYYSSPAFAQQGSVTATGMLSEAAPHGEDPTPVYAITDEATGTSYELVSGFVELQDYVGQKVTIQGVPVPGPGDPSKPRLLNVTQVRPADGGEDPNSSDKVTLSFELTVEGEPPAGAEFLGLTATESLSLTPLTDPDGDGTYTGSMTVAKFAPGGPPEPVSISPVQIVQGPPTGATSNGPQYRVIKDFGSVKLDGDKTLAASISFDDNNGGQAEDVQGTITSISGSAVLVEETPSAEESGDKGYFTVTDETEITKQEDDGESAPATFEDLEVGQQVEATYSGAVAESYPTQGNARSITILEGSDNTETSATLSFELTVEGEPPANAVFSGFIPAEGGISVPLTDPDGDGLYTGSTTVDRFGPGPRPVPPGTEPVSLPVQIVQGTGVIKDFGLVKIDGDKTFSASVSFGGDGGGTDNNNGGSGNSGSGSGPGGISTLPYTGGTLLIAGLAGALLIGGGLLIRGLTR
jgi:hypothetical protein